MVYRLRFGGWKRLAGLVRGRKWEVVGRRGRHWDGVGGGGGGVKSEA